MPIFAAGLLVAWFAISAGGDNAQAIELLCDSPTAMESGDRSEKLRAHFHPRLTVVVYLRSLQGSQSVHDVTKLITPPHGLGIDGPGIVRKSNSDAWSYRRIHSHDATGLLHVEPVKERVPRLCQILKLWAASSGSAETIAEFTFGKTAHVRIGDTYTKNMPIENIMQIPLNHNMPITIFVEGSTNT